MIIHDLWVGVEECVLEVIERVGIQGKLPLQRAIGHAAPALEHGEGLIEDVLKRHTESSLSPVAPR